MPIYTIPGRARLQSVPTGVSRPGGLSYRGFKGAVANRAIPGIFILMKHAVVLLLVVLFVSLSSVVFAKAPPLREAARDAERDAEHDIRSGSWFAFGFFCGGIGVLSAYLSSPSPDPMRLVGKSPVYVESYMWIYGPAVKERRLKSSVLGCLTMSAFNTFYWATW